MKMLKYLVVVFSTVAVVSGTAWVSQARLNNYKEYWMKLMQGLTDEIEKREWSSLKLTDITQTIDDNLYDLHVAGTVNYVNGFLVSIQKLDVTDIEQMILVNRDGVPHATVSGWLNFRDMMIGYDVVADMRSPPDPEFRSTGTYLHTLVQFQLSVTQNMVTKELSGSFSVGVSGGRDVRMIYMPASNVTEALGRRFLAGTLGSATLWARNIFVPIMLDLAANKYVYPNVCFRDCSENN